MLPQLNFQKRIMNVCIVACEFVQLTKSDGEMACQFFWNKDNEFTHQEAVTGCQNVKAELSTLPIEKDKKSIPVSYTANVYRVFTGKSECGDFKFIGIACYLQSL